MTLIQPNFDIVKFQKLKRSLDKVGNNKNAKHWQYADYDVIIESVQPRLDEHGYFIQDVITGTAVVTRVYKFPEDGEPPSYIESTFHFSGDLDPMDAGKAITFGRRYNIKTLLAIRTGDEDTDGQDIKRSVPRTSRRISRRDRAAAGDPEVY